MNKGKSMLKRVLTLVMALVLCTTLITVPSTEAQAASKKKAVKSITVNNLPAKTLTLKKGKSFKLNVTVKVTGGASKKVTYKSSNTKVATVNSKGKITAKKKGKATITITSKADSSKKLKIKVTVGKPVKKVKLSQTSATVITGKKLTLKATVTPKKASNKKVVWTSSDTKVATVNKKGVVKTLKAGTAVITATAKDGSGKSKSCTVTVVDPVSVSSVNVVDSSTVEVTLSRAYEYTKTDFTLNSKSSGGSYGSALTIDSVATTDNKTYTIKLNSASKLIGDGTVKVTIATFNASKEAAYSNPVTISSMEVLNGNSITVTLSDAWTFDASGFTVKTKSTAGGSYLKEMVVDSVTTTDNQTYVINLSTESAIYANEYAQVTLATFNTTAEAAYTKPATSYTYDDTYYKIEKGDTINEYYYLYGSGYSTVSVSGLPSGITASSVKNSGSSQYIRFYGTPNTCGKTTATVTMKDELGNTYTDKITFMVYDDTHMYAFGSPVYYLIGAEEVSIYKRIYVCGGDGEYTYSLTGATYDATMSGSYIYATFKAAATYTLNVKVTDGSGHTATTSVVFDIKQGVTISGVVTDSAGNGISGATVTYTNNNPGEGAKYTSKYAYYYDDEDDYYYSYMTSKSGSVETDEKGAYSLLLLSGSYDITATYKDSVISLYSQSLTSTKSGFDLKLPLYKVVVYSNNTNVPASEFGTWYDSEMEAVGSGDTLYLRAGTYTLKTLESTYSYYTYTASMTVTVSNGSVVKTASVSMISQPTTLSYGSNNVRVKGYDIGYTYTYYKYTPTVSGEFTIKMTQNTATEYEDYYEWSEEVYNANTECYETVYYYEYYGNESCLRYTTSTDGDWWYYIGNSYKYTNGYSYVASSTITMEAGTTYYFRTYTANSDDVSVTISITKN